MRFLVTEKQYETPIAAGSLHYQQDDKPLGVVEHWRVTAAPEQFSIVRVDFDMRAYNGRSYLFHLVLDGERRPERMVYRFFDDEQRIELAGNLLFADETVVNRQTVGDETTTKERPSLPLLMPGVVGLGLLARERPEKVITLDIFDEERILPMVSLPVLYRAQRTRNLIPIKAGATVFTTTYLSIMWTGQSYTVWRDKAGHPVKMERDDGLLALEKRPMRFR